MTAATEDLEVKAARLPTAAIAPGAVAVRGDTGDRLVIDVLGQPTCDCPAAHYRKPCSHRLAATTRHGDTMATDNALQATGDRDLEVPGRFVRRHGHLADVQPRLRELGRIRLGEQVPTAKGGTRPTPLDTFRLTSPSRRLIEAAAGMYGGRPGEWTPPDGPPSWEVVIEADTLPVALPPGLTALSQAYELWRAGGCQRRCDGHTEELTGQPCLCPPAGPERADAAAEGEACSPTSRLSVLLPDLPDLGVWRLEAHGWYAAAELAGTAALIERLTASGTVVHGELRIDRRSIKRPNQPRRDFVVPVLEVPFTVGQLLDQATDGPPVLDGPDKAAAHLDERSAGPSGPPEQPSPASDEDGPPLPDPPPDRDDGGQLDRNVQAEQVLRRIEEAGVSSEAFHALLEVRYDGAVHVDQLTDDQLAGLWRVTSTDAGLRRLAAAAAADLATGGPSA